MNAIETQIRAEAHTELRRIDHHRSVFIGPRPVALAWVGVMALVIAINPATADTVQPTLALTILGNLAVLAFYATVTAGLTGARFTDRIGMAAGALFMAGHLVCGIDGHVPMTSAVWIAQLGLVAAASAVSALALATRR